jgi:alpha-1,2-mannosyltransferase
MIRGAPEVLMTRLADARAAFPFPTAMVAACVLLPVLAMALLGWRYAWALQGLLPVDLTNLDALRRVATTFLDPSTKADSWRPMQRALEVLNGAERNSLYETLFFREAVRFQYPPTSLLPLELLSSLGLSGPRALNGLNSLVLALNAAAMAALAFVQFQRRGAPRPGWPSPVGMAVLAGGCTFLFYPLLRAHLLGQIQLWIDLLFTLAVLTWVLDRRLLAGVLVGLACTIKPQLGLLVVWALLWRQTRFVAGAALALGPIAMISLSRYGVHNHLEYLQVLSFLSRHGESFFANNSVNGILNGYLSPDDTTRWSAAAFTPFNPWVYAGTMAASLVFYGLLVVAPLWARTRHADQDRRRAPQASDFGVAAICTIMGSPVAWEHHYGLLAPLFIVALAAGLRAPEGASRTWLLVLTFAAWALTSSIVPFAGLLAGTPLAVLQAYCFFGALLLLGCLLASRRTAS